MAFHIRSDTNKLEILRTETSELGKQCRYEWEFNNKQRHTMVTVQISQEEWIEYSEAYKDSEKK